MEPFFSILFALAHLVGLWGLITENRRTGSIHSEENDDELVSHILELAPDLSEWSTEVILWGYNESGINEYSAHETLIEIPELE